MASRKISGLRLKKHLVCLLSTLVFCLLILPINERLALTVTNNRETFLIAYFLKLLFAIFFYCLIWFLLSSVEKFRAKDKDFLSWLKFSGIYAGIMFVFFMLLYPGHWVWDEFNILNSVKEYGTNSWQTYFTNIFYTFSLYIIPSAVSIVVFQVLFISTVVGYVVSQCKKLFKNGHFAWVLFAVFLLPPIILNNFYPLRLTMYSYIELLLLCMLFVLHTKKFKTTNKYITLLQFSVLITLVSFWRSEGLYYLILLPLVIYWLKIFNKKKLKSLKPYLFTGFSLVIVFLGLGIARFAHDSQYDLTAYINPLSNMLQRPLKGNDIDKRLDAIDKVLDVEVLKKNPSYDEVPAFWEGVVRKDYEPHLKEFNQQYAYLVFHNPGLFLESRWQTFLSTNGFGESLPFVNRNQITPFIDLEDNPTQSRIVANFQDDNYLAAPFSSDLKKETTELLAFHEDNGRFTWLGKVFWNVIPVIVLSLGLGIFHLLKRRFFYVFLIGLVLLRVPFLFVTAPANYFMYYLPVYIIGYCIVALNLAIYLDRWRQTTKNKE